MQSIGLDDTNFCPEVHLETLLYATWTLFWNQPDTRSARGPRPGTTCLGGPGSLSTQAWHIPRAMVVSSGLPPAWSRRSACAHRRGHHVHRPSKRQRQRDERCTTLAMSMPSAWPSVADSICIFEAHPLAYLFKTKGICTRMVCVLALMAGRN